MDAMFAGDAAMEVSRRIGRVVTPREVTGLFYDRVVAEDLGPVVSGRRVIRPEALDAIVAALRERDATRRGRSSKGDSGNE